jgi:hypothetical protein
VGGLSLVTDHGHNDSALTKAHIAFQDNNKDKLKTTCPVPECEKEFAFNGTETRLFELPFSYSNVAISTNLNCGEVLSTPRLLSSGIATITELLIQNQLLESGSFTMGAWATLRRISVEDEASGTFLPFNRSHNS